MIKPRRASRWDQAHVPAPTPAPTPAPPPPSGVLPPSPSIIGEAYRKRPRPGTGHATRALVAAAETTDAGVLVIGSSLLDGLNRRGLGEGDRGEGEEGEGREGERHRNRERRAYRRSQRNYSLSPTLATITPPPKKVLSLSLTSLSSILTTTLAQPRLVAPRA